MAAGKNKKGKTNNGGSQANVQHHGLMALESRVLFSAAALVSDVPEPVNDASAAIEVSQLTPVEDTDVETYAVMGINPDSMFPTDEPEGSNPTPHPMPVPELSDSVSKRRLEHGPGLHDSVLDLVGVINPDSMRPAVNSFRGCVPTDPCSMLLTPVEDSDVAALSGQTIGEADSFFDIFTELSRVGDEPRDIVDSAQVVNPDSMRPTENINATSNRPVSVSPAIQDFWVAPSLDAPAILADKPDLVFDSVQVVNPDSMRPADEGPILTPGIGQLAFRGLNPIRGSVIMTAPAGADEPEGSNPTPHPMPVPELSDSVSKRRLEHGPGLHDSVLDSVRGSNWNVPDMDMAPV